MGPALTFADVANLADYLADLGVTHAYLSPILAPTPGSTHGYDVVDHARLNPELGGENGFDTMAQALRARGVGVVVDIVPNHMAIPVPETLNAALWSVLRQGQSSPFARWFDIDWQAGGGRVVLPFLDGPLAHNLANLRVADEDGEPVLRYFDHRFPVAEGTESLPLEELLEAQHYRLADWRAAASELNYRRFVDITSLIGVRVEDPEVFDATHAVIVELVGKGAIDGLRIDHPDGLANPGEYLARLAQVAGSRWTVVEKILARREPLPPDWASAGTTGYDALNAVNSLLVDPRGEAPLNRIYTEATGDAPEFAPVAETGKRLVAEQVLLPEVNRLARLLPGGEAGERASAREAIVDVLCGLDVYRPFATSPRTVESLERACEEAIRRRPHNSRHVEAVLAHALDGSEFATRFGQTAAALYAKGVEDTAFYRHSRLLSLNEVGGDPAKFGISIPEFHEFSLALQAHSPSAMTTLSTHDTKRGEDVRARIAVLSEVADEWEHAVTRWLSLGEKLGCPDARTGYFFWQTIVGGWPLDAPRAVRYMEKATREAKLTTSWHRPDERYEAAVRRFVDAVFDDDGVMADVGMFVATIEPAAAANSLTQKLIQLTMPGIPDIYQGCELATFNLVDPDNRGPVDFGVRREALLSLLDDKLRITATVLRLRREHPEWFASYEPLLAQGPAAEHLVAFARSGSLVTLAARFTARLRRTGGWRDTKIVLPKGTWVDALSGREHGAGARKVEEVLRGATAALLVPGVTLTTTGA